MKQQLRLPTLLLTCAIATSNLSSAQAQKASVRKPAVRTTKPAPQGGLSITDMFQIKRLSDLPSVDEYLAGKNWRFHSSKPEEAEDEVTYEHSEPNGDKDGFASIYFCNKSDNKFCDKPQIHEGRKTQHAYLIIYQTTKTIHDNMKAELKAVMKPSGSRISDNTISTIFKGKDFKIEFNTDNTEASTLYGILFKSLAVKEETLNSEQKP